MGKEQHDMTKCPNCEVCIATLRAENAKLREEVQSLGLDLAYERQRSMHNDDRIERLLSYVRVLRDRTPSRATAEP